jgi:hypothetical protein
MEQTSAPFEEDAHGPALEPFAIRQLQGGCGPS